MAERRRSRRATDDEELDRVELDDEPEPSDEGESELAGEGEPELAGEAESSANGRGSRGRRPARASTSRAPDLHPSGLTAREAAKAALRQIVELTAKRAEGITAVQRTEDGWLIGVEVVEDRRIPSSADTLATYEATIDADGELMSYRRVRRYPRGRGDGSEER